MKPISQLSDEELLQQALRASRLPDAPPALIRAAIDRFDIAPAAQGAQPTPLADALRKVVRRIEAALTFDSWAVAPAAFGMRALPAATRHLRYSAQGRDIDVRITPLANH